MRMTARQWADLHFRPSPPPARLPEREPGRPPVDWLFTVPGVGVIRVPACCTKSEARALLKRTLKRKGLPAGTAGRLADRVAA